VTSAAVSLSTSCGARSDSRSTTRRQRGGAAAEAGFRVEAGQGSLSCHRLFLAANGYTPGLGFLRREASPLWSFGSLTPVLGPAEQAALPGARRWGVLPMDPAGSTVRRTPDQRILIRNTFHYTPELGVRERVRAAALERHRRAFVARFPMLREVPFAHTWSGLMGMSENGQLSFGELAPRLYTAAVFNAAGLAMGTASGRLVADLALGADSPELADLRRLPPPSRLPLEPWRTLAGRRRVARQNHQAGAYL